MNLRDRFAADALQRLLVLPPSASADVCPGCLSWRDPCRKWCPNCETARKKLRFACQAVIPISLYNRPSEFRDVISRYKDRPEHIENSTDILPADISQEHCVQQIGLIINRFLIEFLPLLERQNRQWDYLTVVPSGWRKEIHPMVPILSAIGVGKVEQPLRRAPAEPLSHNHPNEKAFKVTGSVNGKSILLVDDVFTTGASIHSAASALSIAGANVLAGIAVARRIRPEYNEYSKSVWARQSSQGYNWNIAAERGASAARLAGKPRLA